MKAVSIMPFEIVEHSWDVSEQALELSVSSRDDARTYVVIVFAEAPTTPAVIAVESDDGVRLPAHILTDRSAIDRVRAFVKNDPKAFSLMCRYLNEERDARASAEV